MSFIVFIEPRALTDIQKAMNYYDNCQTGLGKKFETVVDKHILTISKNPFFQIRYNGVRCLPVKTFPFMIHFVIDEERNEVFIISVFHTSKNNNEWLINIE